MSDKCTDLATDQRKQPKKMVRYSDDAGVAKYWWGRSGSYDLSWKA